MSTQTQHPWRATLRTVFQALIALAIVVPLVLAELGHTDLIVAGVSVVAVCAAITRVMAIPQVVALLERFVPWLAPEPRPRRHPADDAALGFAAVAPPPPRQAPHRGPSRDRSRPGKDRIRERRAGGFFLESDPNDVFDED